MHDWNPLTRTCHRCGLSEKDDANWPGGVSCPPPPSWSPPRPEVKPQRSRPFRLTEKTLPTTPPSDSFPPPPPRTPPPPRETPPPPSAPRHTHTLEEATTLIAEFVSVHEAGGTYKIRLQDGQLWISWPTGADVSLGDEISFDRKGTHARWTLNVKNHGPVTGHGNTVGAALSDLLKHLQELVTIFGPA